jgi:hypothetical protein
MGRQLGDAVRAAAYITGQRHCIDGGYLVSIRHRASRFQTHPVFAVVPA